VQLFHLLHQTSLTFGEEISNQLQYVLKFGFLLHFSKKLLEIKALPRKMFEEENW
jgi:hypothetical protein